MGNLSTMLIGIALRAAMLPNRGRRVEEADEVVQEEEEEDEEEEAPGGEGRSFAACLHHCSSMRGEF